MVELKEKLENANINITGEWLEEVVHDDYILDVEHAPLLEKFVDYICNISYEEREEWDDECELLTIWSYTLNQAELTVILYNEKDQEVFRFETEKKGRFIDQWEMVKEFLK